MATEEEEEEELEEQRGPVPAAMDQCVTVERELEKVLQKFSGYGQLCERSLEELIQYAGGLRREILQTESTWRHPQSCPHPVPHCPLPSCGAQRPKAWGLCGLGPPSPPFPSALGLNSALLLLGVPAPVMGSGEGLCAMGMSPRWSRSCVCRSEGKELKVGAGIGTPEPSVLKRRVCSLSARTA